MKDIFILCTEIIIEHIIFIVFQNLAVFIKNPNKN